MRHGFAVCLAMALLVGLSAPAAAQTWTGNGADDNWTTPDNWDPTGIPASDLVNTDLLFDGATRLTPVADNPWSLHSMSFAETAGAFVIGGQTLTLGEGGISLNGNNALDQTIDNDIVVAADQTWASPNNQAALILNGDIDLGSYTVDSVTANQPDGWSASAPNIEFNGNLTGDGELSIGGWGAYYFRGDNTGFTGVIDSSTHQRHLYFDGPSALGGATIELTSGNRKHLRNIDKEAITVDNKFRLGHDVRFDWGPWNLAGEVEFVNTLQFLGSITLSGETYGEGGLEPRWQTQHCILSGDHRHLGETNFTSDSSSLTVDGLLTLGDVVGKEFVEAAPVIVGADNTLDGAGEIYRPVTLEAGAILDGALSFGNDLTLNGAAGSGSVTILDGGLLMGNGSIGGDVSILSGGELAPGSSVGTLTQDLTALTLDAGSTSSFQIASLSEFDRVEGIGLLTYGGELSIELLDGYIPEMGDSFDLFGLEEGVGTFDTFDDSAASLPGGLDWSFDPDAGALSVVPEPATALMLLGAAAVVFKRRRK